jgi:uncharacterized membrane protein YdbT with pleckstrin-like domain
VAFNLGPGEQIVFEGHPSWRAILDFYIKGIVITAVLALLVVAWGETIGDGVNDSAVVIVLLVGAAITVLAGFLRRVSTRYTITNRRLHTKHGIVSREVQETRLNRVQDVTYSQTIIQRVLGIGDVDFDTASNDPTDFVFAGVADPAGVVEAVHKVTGSDDTGLGDRDTEIQPQP